MGKNLETEKKKKSMLEDVFKKNPYILLVVQISRYFGKKLNIIL